MLRSDRMITEPQVPLDTYVDGFGNTCTRIVAPAGGIRLTADGLMQDSGLPDPIYPYAEEHPVASLPHDTLVYLLGSRYCETERLMDEAWRLFGHGWGVLEVVFVFLFVDLFENIGTLVAVTRKAGLMQPDGSIPRLNRMLYADSIASMIGALLGTSTVTSYVESAAGVEAGGRSGLTAVVTGLLFLVALPFAPYAQLVPLSATAPALIVVGALMMAPLVEIDWNNSEVAIPAFLALVMIPLTFSIANGLAFGITAHALIKALRREFTRHNLLLFVLAALFVFRFAYIAEV